MDLLSLPAVALLATLVPAQDSAARGAGAVELRPWSLDEIYGEAATLKPALPAGIQWLPGGDALLYRKKDGETTHLIEFDVAGGTARTLLDWSALQAKLRAQRSDRVKPAMDDTNRTGRFSFHPLLSPDGNWLVGHVARDLYVLELGSGEARFLTNDDAAETFFQFRPDSGAVAFARDNDLYVVELASGEETRLTNRGSRAALQNGVADWVYEEELGLQQSFWWSPDGQRIAYLQFDTAPVSIFPITDDLPLVADLEQQRYPKTGGANSHVRLGILDVDTKETRWVASGDTPEAYLVDAEWVDDDGLWYLWLNRDQTRLELRMVDGAGVTRTLVSEDDERWVAVGPDPEFLGDGTFLWTSERDGWRHLYRYGLDGKLRGRVTTGAWGVSAIAGLVADESAVVYVSSEASPLERHVYRVDLDGSNKRRLSGPSGWHAASLAPDGEHWLDTWSATDVPTRIELVSASDGRESRTVDDGSLPGLDEHAWSETRFELARVAEDLELWTRTIVPPDFDPQHRYPVIVYVYGGPGSQTVRNRWDGARALYHQYLVQQGALVFSIDNRGTGGRGRDFERLLYRRLGSLEVEDQRRGVDWLREQTWVDPERIGVYGGSYGGFMTLHCLLRAPGHFRAGVSYAPVTDFRFYDTIYTERYMDTPAENPEGYSGGAPLEEADALEGALLLVHGTMDNNVHLQNTVQMIDRLTRAGKDFDLMLYPRTRHAMRDEDYRLHFQRLSAGFLSRELGLGVRPQ